MSRICSRQLSHLWPSGRQGYKLIFTPVLVPPTEEEKPYVDYLPVAIGEPKKKRLERFPLREK